VNHLERFRAVMDFQPVDRLPRIEWAGWWDQTLERWQSEGLALSDRYEVIRHFGLDVYWQHWFGPQKPTLPAPAYHGAGLMATDDEYDALREHLYPETPDELLAQLAQWQAGQDRGDGLLWITLEGVFWFPRKLFGIERHLYGFYDQPELMHRVNGDLLECHLRVLERIAPACRPAFVTLAEDMSYNHGPMLSEALFEEFVAPYYRRLIPRLAEMGMTVLVDTDGDVTAMVPWLLRTGVRGVLPLERQAGVDAAALRRAYPDFLMLGQFDKMVMPRGEAAMRAEFERLLPAMRSGGFIPSVDHQTPPGVSLEQYRSYVALLKEYTQRAAT